MKAILMAAGVGSRISRAVSKPKSTLDVGGTPLITRTVDMLISYIPAVRGRGAAGRE